MPRATDEASRFEPGQDSITRALGAENRQRLLNLYFGRVGKVTPGSAWQHVYRLLLWIDRTTALAHCYESDKAQPGRAWYGRSLAFHDWLAGEFHVRPGDLGENIDWLFREAIKDLTSRVLTVRATEYERQRAPYAGRGLPEPGEDPELVALIKEVLGEWMIDDPPEDELRKLTRQIYAYMTQENKRRNLVGEGFEDVIAALIARIRLFEKYDVSSRIFLHDLPGFYAPSPNEKAKKVDLALISESSRILVSAKWSIRADREEQFQSDFETYARLESEGKDFAYTLITNEFDAARLKAACERRRQNAPLFTNVVHLNPEGVRAAYGHTTRGSWDAVQNHIESGRLKSLEAWLAGL